MTNYIQSKNAIPVYLVFICFVAQISLAGGRIVSWGGGVLGDETKTEMSAISAGYLHSLALTTSGVIVAWGDDKYGQTDIPQSINSNITTISAGGFHNLAIKKGGQVVAWGSNDDGQSVIPDSLKAKAKKCTAVSAGMFHSLAIHNTGIVIAWGYNAFGQTYVPLGLDDVEAVSAGAMHSVALRDDGRIFSWGDNSFGQLNFPGSDDDNKDFTAISAGYFHTLALDKQGRVIAWGDNTYGQCNVPSSALTDIVAISAGQTHSMALKADGTLITWGGKNTEDSSQEPAAPVSSINLLSAISAGGYHSLGLIPSSADYDHNGIPDWWEIQNGIIGSQGRNSDYDSDGVSDFDEYISDTSPTDSSRSFDVTISKSSGSGTCDVTFGPLSIERLYTLESATDLNSNTWTPVSGHINMTESSSGGTRTMTIESTDNSNCKIYRVSVSTP